MAEVSPGVRSKVLRSIAYMQKHHDRIVYTDELARAVGLSQFYYARTFSAVLGIGPSAYQRNMKRVEAAHLLITTNLSIVHVCNLVGFDSIGQFTNKFKEVFGVTPLRLRERARALGVKQRAHYPRLYNRRTS